MRGGGGGRSTVILTSLLDTPFIEDCDFDFDDHDDGDGVVDKLVHGHLHDPCDDVELEHHGVSVPEEEHGCWFCGRLFPSERSLVSHRRQCKQKKLDWLRLVGHVFMPKHHLYKIWVKLRLYAAFQPIWN